MRTPKLGRMLIGMTTHFAPDQAGYFEPEFTQGDRLRKARELAGLSQEQLAAELGISKNTVSNYESDNVRAKHPTMLAWSMRTRVTLDWLKGTPNGPTPPGRRPRRDSNTRPMAYNNTGSRPFTLVPNAA